MLAHIFFPIFSFPTSLNLSPVYQLGSTIGHHVSKFILLEVASFTINVYVNVTYKYGNVLLLRCVREYYWVVLILWFKWPFFPLPFLGRE